MKQNPLFLKVKRSSDESHFDICTNNAISFQDTRYDFSSVFQDSIPTDCLLSLMKSSATVMLMGPVGSGKSTSLSEILRFFTSLGGNANMNACEVSKNSSFVDLLDAAASRKYLSSMPIDNQLKKVSLDSRVISKLSKERGMASSAPRACLLVNIYYDSKMLSIVDMMGSEITDVDTSSSVTASHNFHTARHLTFNPRTGRSQNLMTNLILRRVSSSNISFIMHLDQSGNVDLIRSSLSNLAQVVRTFRPDPAQLFYPSRSSSPASSIPSYARPTISSASPNNPLSSYKVTKPTKRRLAPPAESLAKSALSHRQRPLALQKRGSNSPSHKSTEWDQLQETVITLRRQVNDQRSQCVESIETLRTQLHQIKNHSLVVVRNGLSKARLGLENISAELRNQEAITETLENEVCQLKSEKRVAESKLSETSQFLLEKEAELMSVKETTAEEKRSLAAAFESEVNSMREKYASLEKINSSLAQSKDCSENEISRLRSENEHLILDNKNLTLNLSQATEECISLQKQMQSAQESNSCDRESFERVNSELTAKISQIHELEAHVKSKEGILIEKTAVFEEERHKNSQEIERLKKQAESKEHEYHEREQDIRQNMEREIAESKNEVNRLEILVDQTNTKFRSLEESTKLQESEISTLKANLQQKELAISDSRLLSEKCSQLEALIQELTEKAKKKDIEHERHVSQLTEEMSKRKANLGSPKKIVEYPDLDFNNSNNTFSSIDVFDDQTEYMNFFRRPALGRSPIPSPTRALTESNVRANVEGKLTKKSSLVNLQLRPLDPAEQENVGNP